MSSRLTIWLLLYDQIVRYFSKIILKSYTIIIIVVYIQSDSPITFALPPFFFRFWAERWVYIDFPMIGNAYYYLSVITFGGSKRALIFYFSIVSGGKVILVCTLGRKERKTISSGFQKRRVDVLKIFIYLILIVYYYLYIYTINILFTLF